MYSLSHLKEIIFQNRKLIEENQSLNKQLKRKEQELEEKTGELREAEQKAREESKAKTEFLSSMSHEIRTPMNAILGVANLLVRENPREDQLEQLEILDYSAKTLLALINDMLDFSKIESGQAEFGKVAFNLPNLLESLLYNFQFAAEKKDIELYANLAEDVPKMLVGDPNQFNRILNSLVSNAVKFTEYGSVRITVEKMREPENEVKLLVKVKDTGIGISKDKQSKIFDPFFREEAEDCPFGGTGLGLTISKKLVEIQGGCIYVESEKGKGSTFFIEMPFETQKVEKEKPSRSQSSTLPEGLEGATVLVAEDNIVNQKVLSRFLQKWEVEVIIAEDGKQALDKLNKNLVNLVLMDLQMPVIDGYEAARSIRSLGDPQKSHIPIIALSAAALKEVRNKVLAAGMDDYLTKPFNPQELQKKLEHYILKQPS